MRLTRGDVFSGNSTSKMRFTRGDVFSGNSTSKMRLTFEIAATFGDWVKFAKVAAKVIAKVGGAYRVIIELQAGNLASVFFHG